MQQIEITQGRRGREGGEGGRLPLPPTIAAPADFACKMKNYDAAEEEVQDCLHHVTTCLPPGNAIQNNDNSRCQPTPLLLPRTLSSEPPARLPRVFMRYAFYSTYTVIGQFGMYCTYGASETIPARTSEVLRP